MALNKNSNIYVVIFVVIVTVICGFIIAGAAIVLKPAQEAQLRANLQKNVLKVSNIKVPEGSTLNDTYQKYIRVAYVDIRNGQFYKAPQELVKNYSDVLISSKLSQYVETISGADNKPGLKGNQLAWVQKVYLVKSDTGYNEVILPFYGNGLWSVMYGFLAVNQDGNTIDGITYYQQGETPGLGGEVENPRFTNQFKGKLIYKDGNFTTPEFKLVKNSNPSDKFQVSALTGATLTSNGVNNQLGFWLSSLGYGKFLDNLHSGKFKLKDGLLIQYGNLDGAQ